MATPPSPFDPTPWLTMMSRLMKGPEQALRVYRELLGLESGSRERAVDLMGQMAQGMGVDASPFFEGVLRFAPAPTARIAAAAYLAERGHEDTVVEVLEGLGSPVLGLTLLGGLLDVLASRPATESRVARLLAFAQRFEDDTRYPSLSLSDFTGKDVKQAVRRALAESLLRRDAPDAVDWPRG